MLSQLEGSNVENKIHLYKDKMVTHPNPYKPFFQSLVWRRKYKENNETHPVQIAYRLFFHVSSFVLFTSYLYLLCIKNRIILSLFTCLLSTFPE